MAAASHPVAPLARAPGTLVLVDGHPICERCGRPAGPVSDGWRHVGARVRYPPRTEPAITWDRLRRLSSYAEFVLRFPSALGGQEPISQQDFEVGMERLERFHREARTLCRPHRLGPADNPYLDLVTILWGGSPRRLAPGLARVLDLARRRRELAARFAWAVPGDSALAAMAELGPLLDGGAGTGYWAALLSARGVDVLAVDRNPPDGESANQHHVGAHTWTPVVRMETAAAVRANADRTLLLCWPPYDDDTAGYRPLQCYSGSRLAYLGEPAGGATGTPRLDRELELNWTPEASISVPAWPGIRDRLVIYRRNPSRLPQRQRDRCDECRRFVPTGSIGRCARCRSRHPAALTLRFGEHLAEYPAQALALMPDALVAALRSSPRRVDDGSPGRDDAAAFTLIDHDP